MKRKWTPEEVWVSLNDESQGIICAHVTRLGAKHCDSGSLGRLVRYVPAKDPFKKPTTKKRRGR
jgi:hypothetical protein